MQTSIDASTAWGRRDDSAQALVIILVAIVVKEDFILAFIVEKYQAIRFGQKTEEINEEKSEGGKEKSE